MTIHCRVIAFLSADTSRDFVTLTFDLLTLSSCCARRVNLATKFEDPTRIRSWVMSYNVSRWLPLKTRTLLLCIRRITWPASKGSKTITFLESPTLICLFIMHFGGSTMNVIKVICENNARPCVKRRMNFFACAKSRDLLKVTEMSYCSRSLRRRLTVLGFKSWAYSRICAIFSSICTVHAQKRLFMNFRCKFRNRRSIPRPRFRSKSAKFRRFGDVFRWLLHFIF